MAVGNAFGCAALADGEVRCWDLDRVISGAASGSQPLLLEIALDEPVVEVVAGSRHACARSVRGKVWCWQQAGQPARPEPLGPLARGPQGAEPPPPTSTPLCSPVPGCGHVQGPTPLAFGSPEVVAVSRATRLAAGARHDCALVVGGRVFCWGEWSWGQLGTARAPPPGRPVEVRGLPAVRDVFAGRNLSVAVDAAGAAYAWGETAGPAGSLTARPRPFEGVADVRDLVIEGFTLVSMPDGLRCQAHSASGQCGVIDDELHSEFREIDVRAAEIAAGSRHACARVGGGRLVCWGGNASGQLGDGSGVGGVPSPARVEGLAPSAELAVGAHHTCSAGEDGVRCWGQNAEGQVSPEQPAHVVRSPTLSVGRARRVVAGSSTSAAIRDDGVAVWGTAACMGLRRGRLPLWSEIVAPSDAVLGRMALCVLDRAHRVHCTETGDRYAARCRRGRERVIDGVLGLSGSGYESGPICAVLAAGAVSCWGELLAGPQSPETARRVQLRSPALDVSAGLVAACACQRDGAVVCWYPGDDGAPEPVPGIADCARVAYGGGFACVLRRNGVVTCFGSNDHGQLGNGTFDDQPAPGLPVALPERAVAVGAGARHTCARLRSGAVWCWGDRGWGQLGDGGGGGIRLAPVEVHGLP